MYNVHIHVGNFDSYPEFIVPGFSLDTLRQKSVLTSVKWIMHNLNPFSDKDILDRATSIIQYGAQSHSALFEYIRTLYPEGTKFSILVLDYDYMGAGKPKKAYINTLAAISAIKMRYPDTVDAFVGIDPRRPDVMTLLKRAVEDYNYSGIKLYPHLGFSVNDARLTPVYEYANEHELPITMHTSWGGLFGRNIPSYDYVKQHSEFSISRWKWIFSTCNTKIRLMTHPRNLVPVIEKYPNIRWNLAHIGGEDPITEYLKGDIALKGDYNDNWTATIIDLIRTYPNIFTDIACQMDVPGFFDIISVFMDDPVLRKSILFGSDFYVNQVGGSEERYSKDLKKLLAPPDFEDLVYNNPKKFLKK